MSDNPNDWNQQNIEEFRANAGKVGGPFEGSPMVLLHHVGARSGTERVNPLMCRVEGDTVMVFASKAGAPDSPDWYYNLKANPRVSIEIGSETRDVVAEEVTGPERDRIFDAQKTEWPQFAEYEANTSRKIPVMALRPA